MKSITASVCLQVSVHTAYLAWVRLDAFRAIITRLCRQSSASLRHRTGSGGGRRRRQERRRAQLIEQIPDQYLAWRDIGIGESTSSAEFEPLSDHRSRVTVFVNFAPNHGLPVIVTRSPAEQEQVRLALLDFKAQTEQGARGRAVG